MVLLSQILEYLCTKLNAVITGDGPKGQPVSYIKCWQGEIAADSHTLYLAQTEQMSLPLPGNAPVLFTGCHSGQQRDGAFCLCLDISVDDLKLTLEQYLTWMRELSEYRNKLFSILYCGGEIKDYIMLAEEKLHNPILVLSASYRVIAASPDADFSSDSILTPDSEYLHPDMSRLMQRHQILEHIYKSPKAFVFSAPEGTQRWILCPIRIHATAVGFVWVLEQYKNVEESECEIVDILAQAISIEMRKDRFFTGKTGLKYEYFMAELLENRIHDREVLNRRLIEINRKFYHFFRIMVLYMDNAQTNNISQIMQMLREMLPNSMTTYHKDAIVLLFAEKAAVIDPELKERAREFLEPSSFYGGVSNCFTDLLSTHIYYKQAISLANYSKLRQTKEKIVLFDDTVVPHLLSERGQMELESLVSPLIKLLSQYDSEHNTKYIQTLRTYFECNRSANDTASALYLHRSTFFYRLGKIEEIINQPLSDGKLLFSLELSLQILDYIKLNSGHAD